MKELWVEKYRPKSLDEVVGQEEIVERLKAYAKTGNLPHLLFAGPAGTGKTTCAIALARDMFGEDWRQNYFELNSSDERGIDTVRTKVKEIARLAPFGGTNFKIIPRRGRQPDGGRPGRPAAHDGDVFEDVPLHPVRQLLVAAHRADPVPHGGLPVPPAQAGGDHRVHRTDRQSGEAQGHGRRDGSPRLRRGRGHATRGERVAGRRLPR